MSETILDQIVAHKRTELEARKAATPLAELERLAAKAPETRGFVRTLRDRRPAVIAEIKRASPSKGLIREDFDVAAIAASYAEHGAACMSVLTDERFFQGHDDYLAEARAAAPLPALRKDFTIDAYQVVEARALGADCILLIVAILDIMALTQLTQLARNLGLDVLIEVHDRAELDAALSLQPAIVGINNRDLKTFDTRLETTLDLLAHVPSDVAVVTESGIHTRDDVARMRAAGVEAFLVGEAFMRANDPGQALSELFFADAVQTKVGK